MIVRPGSAGLTVAWFITGFERESDTLTYAIDLDDAVRAIVKRSQDEPGGLVGAVSLNDAAVRGLDEILGLDLDPDRCSYVLEYFHPDDYYDVEG